MMITKLKSVRVKDLITISPQGNMEARKIKDCINELNSNCRLFIDYDLLIDTRGTENDLRIFEIWDLVMDLASVIHAGSQKGFRAKIAVLCPAHHYDNASFFEVCAMNRGLNVQAFVSFEKLFEWISIPSELEVYKKSF